MPPAACLPMRARTRDGVLTAALLLSLMLTACGGGGGGGSAKTASTNPTGTSTPPASGSNADLAPSSSYARQCAAPRPAGSTDPVTGEAYDDTQGSLLTENEWIESWNYETYLWYADVPYVDPAGYVLGATVPYVDPTTNGAGTETLATDYEVVDAYFNSQRSPLFTPSGKPKDQFHFTYPATTWDAMELEGNAVGFGFTPIVLAATPPRSVVVAYTDPGTPAASNGIARGAQILDVNGVDVANGSDVNTLNNGLFTPTAGQSYSFTLLDEGATTPRTVTMTAQTLTEVPVQNVGTLPAPNGSVGYILFNAHIAQAESELIAAVNTLQSANGGNGISDLVLDMRYNGGGLLDVASELASMISSSATTLNQTFEQETFNNKNPFDLTNSQTITPFWQTAQGYSAPAGESLPHLNLNTVYVLVSGSTCSASEAVINGLRGVGVTVVLVGDTTCGKPYGFFPQDNCSTTYFTIQFQGQNALGFGAYADGFIPGGTGTTANNLPGCVVADDFAHALGDPNEARLSAALYFRANRSCPSVAASAAHQLAARAQPFLVRPQFMDSRILLPGHRASLPPSR